MQAFIEFTGVYEERIESLLADTMTIPAEEGEMMRRPQDGTANGAKAASSRAFTAASRPQMRT